MSDVSVSLGVTGKDVVLGAFSEVGAAGQKMGETFGSIATKLAGLAAGYVSITATIGAFHGAMEKGGQLADFSEQTGIAVGKLVLLERAFENNGMKAEDLGSVINKMQKFLVEAGDAGSESAEKLHRLGLFSSDLLKLSPDEQFAKIAKTISEIPDPADRAATAMEIFGKKGGRLLALFADLPGAINQAEGEVGGFAKVMDQNAASFDYLGDGIAAIGRKLMEFAAGALVNIQGGLKEFVDLIKNFDAAGFGEKVTKDIAAPLKAIADSLVDGNFKQALEVAFEMVKLQGMKMGNVLIASFQASVAGIFTLFTESFGEGSKIPLLITQSFRSVGLFISKEILTALAEVVSVIPGIGSEMAKGLTEKAELAANKLQNSMNIVANVSAEAGQQFQAASGKALETVQNVYQISDGYFDIASQQEKVQTMSEKIVSDHESLAALTATIAANGKRYEESIVGVRESFSSFKASGGEAGNLAEMAGLKVPMKTFDGNGAGPIDTPSPFSTKPIRGGVSSGRMLTEGQALANAMKDLLQPQDYVQAYTGNRRSFESIQQTMGIRADQAVASDLSYYTGGDRNASKQQVLNDLTSKYRKDGVGFMEARGKAEADYQSLVDQKMGGGGSATSGAAAGKSGSGAGPEAAKSDPMTTVLNEIRDFVKTITNDRLPIQVLA